MDLNYVNQGPEDLASSITAYRLTVQDIEVGASSEPEVLAHVTNNNRSCLSNNLLLNVEGYSFFFNESATAIDFSNCLEGVS